ncbi:uncharacterized protein N7484_006739 [Penicillium longicatenatum]|uniref:uncharacterized protein n=1 Tax=Penicillium longicatenatum TaxID=1561947 RepID=UPI002548022A|nr:uncharacterized protein N7484_006739 [Penicillium longicatenatum]KAJ5644232.1 hypothetical protein N7484_006739 [Penicillium longicatenatum]
MATSNTPPGSVFMPPTPPPTVEKPLSQSAQTIVNRFRRHRKGYRPTPWWEGQLKPSGYTQVLHALDTNKSLHKYVDTKLRYDYDPNRSRLTIRTPSPLHDTFCARIVDEISRQLRQHQQSDSPIANFAQQVQHFATSRILLPEDTKDGKQTYIRREPDASFGHLQAYYPGVVLEVCYSQKSRRVAYVADEYILNTDGSINVVVAFNIDYEGSRRATITVWRPEKIMVDGVQEFRATAVISAEPFRTETGSPIKDIALRLSLRDFATEELSQGLIGVNEEILITSEQLCSTNQVPPGFLKRRRPRTPPEQLSSEEDIERNRKSKRGRHSSDFHPSSSSSGHSFLEPSSLFQEPLSSRPMESRELPKEANDVRKEIKELIPRITAVEEDESGNKKYGGDALLELITRMKAALDIDESWEGRLRYWSKRTKLDLRSQAYLIPIPGEIKVNGWLLKDGFFVQVNNDVGVGADTIVLIIAPR